MYPIAWRQRKMALNEVEAGILKILSEKDTVDLTMEDFTSKGFKEYDIIINIQKLKVKKFITTDKVTDSDFPLIFLTPLGKAFIKDYLK